MVGSNYWSIGIIIDWHKNENGDVWSTEVKFYDNGFCQDASTEGHLVSRYFERDLTRLIDTIKADTEKLGIEWKKPRIFMRGDEEIKEKKYPPDWRKILNNQAERIGWEKFYIDNQGDEEKSK